MLRSPRGLRQRPRGTGDKGFPNLAFLESGNFGIPSVVAFWRKIHRVGDILVSTP
ncbi:hypothetical protein MPNT_630002 [Candidatus Methylacidithermus pantelleriae]|uniref:Uncharacterized protein n=1 Tax=Candidatus Methylacidithermus pantelleriae TaxID=2744239 RepID=A0A8J2BR88_9BACT|nr:hypothetical protein MPNT_630002 [Candidatus Methylacidithermus pantelleriae]